jgi:hypothetical protein
VSPQAGSGGHQEEWDHYSLQFHGPCWVGATDPVNPRFCGDETGRPCSHLCVSICGAGLEASLGPKDFPQMTHVNLGQEEHVWTRLVWIRLRHVSHRWTTLSTAPRAGARAVTTGALKGTDTAWGGQSPGPAIKQGDNKAGGSRASDGPIPRQGHCCGTHPGWLAPPRPFKCSFLPR